jgi:hypothetical protein
MKATIPFSRVLVGALLIALTVALVFPWAPSSAAELASQSEMAKWLEEKGAYYDAHPELKTTKGSGWKPYNRAKWFYEQRLTDGKEPNPFDRWNVWEQKLEIERQARFTPRASWFSLGPANFSGRILDLEFHPTNPDIIYAGSASGGLWKSTDNGDSWAPLTDDLPSLAIGAVALLPWNTNIILIGTGEAANGDVYGVGILKSTDAGVTWNTTDFERPVYGNHGFHVIEVNPTTHTILAGASDGLWRSTDEGETWTAVKEGGDYYDVKWKPGDAYRVYTVKGDDSEGNNIKVSTDDGLTWTKAGTGQPVYYQFGKTKLAVTEANPSYIYALIADQPGNTTGVYRSTDDGATWAERSDSTPNIAGGQGWYNLTLVADPNDAQLIIAGGVRLYRSTNGGTLFSVCDQNGWVHVDHHAATYEPGSNSIVWQGCDGGVYRSDSDGTTLSWEDKSPGLVTYQFYDICVAQTSADTVFGGTQDQGTDQYAGTTTWVNSLGADGMVCNINPTNAYVIYAEIQFGDHRKSQNGGVSWGYINNGITEQGPWVAPTDEDVNTPNHLYTASNSYIYRTTNGGNDWVAVASGSARWISISPLDGNLVWAVQSLVRYTTDDGGSWNNASAYGFTTGSATKILAHPTDVNSAFVTFSGYGAESAHIALTTDMGATWQNVTGDFPSQPVNAIAVDWSNPTYWYIGTDVGVWLSTNGGTNWIPFEAGLPNAVVSDLEIERTTHKLRAGTYGRGLWEIDISSPLTDVDVTVSPAALNLMLDPPMPNPAGEHAWFRFAAKYEGKVTLSVYDVQGRLVSQLVELPRGDGIIRTAPWVTADVPSGAYFVVLRAGEMQKSQKLIVTK